MNPWLFFDRIYYINLDRRIDRREQFLLEIGKVGIENVIRQPGMEMPYNPSYGNHISHAWCIMDAIRWDAEKILIFEDDAEFFPNAIENLNQSLCELPSDWDMFYLGANLDRFPAYYVSDHIIKITGAFATHAYAFRSNMFTLLRDINLDKSVVHNDVSYAELVHPKYNCYLSYPLVAGQRDSYSDIERRWMSSNQMFLERVKRNTIWA